MHIISKYAHKTQHNEISAPGTYLGGGKAAEKASHRGAHVFPPVRPEAILFGLLRLDVYAL